MGKKSIAYQFFTADSLLLDGIAKAIWTSQRHGRQATAGGLRGEIQFFWQLLACSVRGH